MKFLEIVYSAEEIGSALASSYTSCFFKNIYTKKSKVREASIASFKESAKEAQSILIGFLVWKTFLNKYDKNSFYVKILKLFSIHFFSLAKYGFGYAVKYAILGGSYSYFLNTALNLLF